MKVLWLCNIMLPAVAEHLHRETNNKEGWLTGLSTAILARQGENDLELAVAFPMEFPSEPSPDGESWGCRGVAEVPVSSGGVQASEAVSADSVQALEAAVCGRGAARLRYYGFYEDTSAPWRYDPGLEERLRAILQDFAPDVIHCFGTEYPHTLAMTRVCEDKGRLLIGIQGLCFKYADHYMADLPERIQRRFLLRDFLKQDNLAQQQKKYVQRGQYEIEALRNTGHVTGRTGWDRQAAAMVNQEAVYHFMNETLRSNFYGPQWEMEACERYSVFLSQGNYPIKGLHYLLQAMPKILERYPDAKVYVAGDVITRYGTLKEKLKIGSYGKYCLELIRKYRLTEKIVFLGRRNAEEMCAQYLKSHLFLSPSAIENSPNSVGEAMLLGMPVVSSAVGGVADMLKDGEEGILYPCQDTEKLAEAVCRIFGNDDLAVSYGKAARKHALITHDPETNYRRLLEIYHDISST